MYKTLLASAALAICAAPAIADTLPPPPTEIYVAPETQSCNPTMLTVYFKNGEDMLTNHARKAIESTAGALQGCAIATVDLVAKTADGRSEQETGKLAENRIAMVSSALTDTGLMADDATSRSEPVAEDRTTNEPMARRVSVRLAAYRPEIGQALQPVPDCVRFLPENADLTAPEQVRGRFFSDLSSQTMRAQHIRQQMLRPCESH